MDDIVYVIYTTDEEKNAIILGYTENINTAEIFTEKCQLDSNSKYGHFYTMLDCPIPPYYSRPSNIVCRVNIILKNDNREEYELEVIVDSHLDDIVEESDIIYNLDKDINKFCFRFRLDINKTDSYEDIMKEANNIAHDKYKLMINNNDKFIYNIDTFFNERREYISKIEQSKKGISNIIKI